MSRGQCWKPKGAIFGAATQDEHDRSSQTSSREAVALQRSKMTGDLPFWPAALRLDQAAAYCGLSTDTFKELCPVKPIEFTQSPRGRRPSRPIRRLA